MTAASSGGASERAYWWEGDQLSALYEDRKCRKVDELFVMLVMPWFKQNSELKRIKTRF